METEQIVAALVHELERKVQETKVLAKTDSIEVGTPSKGGVLKVYFDALEPIETIRSRVTNAAEALRFGNEERARVIPKEREKANGGGESQ
jgi:hypothetical protein